MVKAICSTCGSSIIAASTCLKTTLVHFSLHSQTALEKFLSLMKETDCLPPFAGKSSERTDSLIRVTTGMPVNTHRTFSPDLSSHGMVHCEFLHISARKLGVQSFLPEVRNFSYFSPNLWCRVSHLKYEIFYISSPETWSVEFSVWNMKFSIFQPGNLGCRFSCLKYEIFHMSSRKIGVQIFLQELSNSPYFMQENWGADFPAWSVKLPIFHSGKLGWQNFLPKMWNSPYFIQESWGADFPAWIRKFYNFIQKNWGLDKNMGNTSSGLTPFELFLKKSSKFLCILWWCSFSEHGLGKMWLLHHFLVHIYLVGRFFGLFRLVLFEAKIKAVNLVYVIYNNLIQSNFTIGFSVV